MVEVLVGLLIATALVRVACELAPGVEIDGWGTAFAAAVVMRVAGFALSFVLATMPVGIPLIGMGVSFVATVIVFAAAVGLLPGLRSEGASGVILAGAIVALLSVGQSYVQGAVAGLL